MPPNLAATPCYMVCAMPRCNYYEQLPLTPTLSMDTRVCPLPRIRSLPRTIAVPSVWFQRWRTYLPATFAIALPRPAPKHQRAAVLCLPQYNQRRAIPSVIFFLLAFHGCRDVCARRFTTALPPPLGAGSMPAYAPPPISFFRHYRPCAGWAWWRMAPAYRRLRSVFRRAFYNSLGSRRFCYAAYNRGIPPQRHSFLTHI